MAGAHTAAPAIGSGSLGLLSDIPKLPQHVAETHLAQHHAEPHPAQHPAERGGGGISPASPLVAAIGICSHYTAAVPSTTITIALSFDGAQGLSKGMGTTCLQQPPEASASLPTDLSLPQSCQESPVVPIHNSINHWAHTKTPGKPHKNGPSVQIGQKSPPHLTFKGQCNEFWLDSNNQNGFLQKTLALPTCSNKPGKDMQFGKHSGTTSLPLSPTSKKVNLLCKHSDTMDNRESRLLHECHITSFPATHFKGAAMNSAAVSSRSISHSSKD